MDKKKNIDYDLVYKWIKRALAIAKVVFDLVNMAINYLNQSFNNAILFSLDIQI